MQGQTTLVLASLLLISFSLSSGITDVATRTMLNEVKRDGALLERRYADLKKDIADLKKDNADLRLLLTEGRAAQLRHAMTSRGLDAIPAFMSLRSTASGGATYIRWGRTSCPAESKLVYKGYVGGSHYTQTGAATNHLCLPENPQYTTSVLPKYNAEVYGTEYETVNAIFQNQDHDVPCALCRSLTRPSVVMIPARTSCYPGFHREYVGYLMASYPGHNAGTEYICVDRDPENVHGGIGDQNGNVLYFTISRCGSLKCPPYEDQRVLSCVVCSE